MQRKREVARNWKKRGPTTLKKNHRLRKESDMMDGHGAIREALGRFN